MTVFIAIGVVLALLIFNEYWWHRRKVHGELSRKFIHITVGSFVAFWPFFLPWHIIQLISVAFLVVVALSKYLRIFQAIHSVQRPTWGEVYFALAVGLTTLITHNKWVYMTALLQMSLADGLAAIVGVRYGKRHHYLVLGHAKSLIGTATFFVVSLGLLIGFSYWSGDTLAALFVIGVASVVTLIENLGVRGLDNLLIPLFVAGALSLVV